jgi:hypothetical protein
MIALRGKGDLGHNIISSYIKKGGNNHVIHDLPRKSIERYNHFKISSSSVEIGPGMGTLFIRRILVVEP